MKKGLFQRSSKSPVLSLIILTILFAFVSPKYSLVGKWSILNLDGTPSGEYLFFNKDSTYSIALQNGKTGERGIYILNDSIFSIKNIKDVCGKDYWGKYNLIFYGNDSVHFTLIEDSCFERRMDIVGYNPGLKRYTAK